MPTNFGSNIVIPNISGSIDGKVPVYNPDGRFQTWALEQLWNGTVGTNRYVPNVGDLVWDKVEREFLEVIDVDPSTLVPTLASVEESVKDAGLVDKVDLVLGVGPGKASDTFRCYIDTSVMPHTLAVDGRCLTFGSEVRTYQICRGSELDGTLKVISAMYDQSGQYVGNSVPLELASMRDHSNFCTWTFPTCYTTDQVDDNEVLQVRVFTADGGLKQKFIVLAENTAFIRLTDTAYKYITHISLETPFLSPGDPNLIEYPLNVPLKGLNLFGIVHYSDGTSRRMPVDGTKFEIMGFNHFVATQVGEQTKLVLQYNLSNDEIHYGSSVSVTKAIQELYRAVSVKEDGSYTVKLFCYPDWIDDLNGYRLRFFMYNLDRNTYKEVTAFTKMNDNTAAFKPKQYGVLQQLSVSVNLRDVNPAYKSWIHVQVIDVVLHREPTDDSGSPWLIGYEREQMPLFGVNNWAEVEYVNATRRLLDISLGETNIEEWYKRMFWATKPLYAPSVEAKSPLPNTFIVATRAKTYEFPIEQWNSKLTLDKDVLNVETVYIRFIRRVGTVDLQLAMAALPVKMV